LPSTPSHSGKEWGEWWREMGRDGTASRSSLLLRRAYSSSRFSWPRTVSSSRHRVHDTSLQAKFSAHSSLPPSSTNSQLFFELITGGRVPPWTMNTKIEKFSTTFGDGSLLLLSK
jgi:hypothetical protein